MMITKQQWIDLLDEQFRKFEPNGSQEHECWNIDIKKKDTLVVCVGESWTWGDGGLQDRSNEIYGRLLSNYFDADWINIGGRGYSNTWILDFANFISHKLKLSDYDKIIFVITMTENGRDFSTAAHHNYDFFKYDTVTEETFNLILSDLEDICIHKLTSILANCDDRYKLIVGNGFAWNQKVVDWLTQKNITQPSMTWLELLADKQNIPSPARTNIVYNMIFDLHFAELLKTNPKYDTMTYKSWAMHKMDLALQTHKLSKQSKFNFDIHPTAVGHYIWSQELIRLICQS